MEVASFQWILSNSIGHPVYLGYVLCEDEIKIRSILQLDAACPNGIRSPLNSTHALELTGHHKKTILSQ